MLLWSFGDLGDDRGGSRGSVGPVHMMRVPVGFKVQVRGECFAAPIALVDAVFRMHFDDVIFEPSWE